MPSTDWLSAWQMHGFPRWRYISTTNSLAVIRITQIDSDTLDHTRWDSLGIDPIISILTKHKFAMEMPELATWSWHCHCETKTGLQCLQRPCSHETYTILPVDSLLWLSLFREEIYFAKYKTKTLWYPLPETVGEMEFDWWPNKLTLTFSDSSQLWTGRGLGAVKDSSHFEFRPKDRSV